MDSVRIHLPRKGLGSSLKPCARFGTLGASGPVVTIAISIGLGRVSPVFEAGGRLLLLEFEHHRAVCRREVAWPDGISAHRAEHLVDLGVEALICGGIMAPTEALLRRAGLRVIPWICGELDEVVEAFRNGTLQRAEFLMPGCCRHRGSRLEGKHGGGRPRTSPDSRPLEAGRGALSTR